MKPNSIWVIKNASQRAESIMNEGKAKYYENAITWLKKVREAYLKSDLGKAEARCDRKKEWSDYRTKLLTIHCRKRKFIGLIKSVI